MERRTAPSEYRAVANSALVVLTDNPANLITLTSPDLAAGLTASVTLTFENAGEVTIIVPVVDGNVAQYATIGPSSTPSA